VSWAGHYLGNYVGKWLGFSDTPVPPIVVRTEAAGGASGPVEHKKKTVKSVRKAIKRKIKKLKTKIETLRKAPDVEEILLRKNIVEIRYKIKVLEELSASLVRINPKTKSIAAEPAVQALNLQAIFADDEEVLLIARHLFDGEY